MNGLMVILPMNTAITNMPERRGLQPKPFWNISARRKGAALIATRNREPPRFDGPEGRGTEDAPGPAGGVWSFAGARPPARSTPAEADARPDGTPRDVAIGDELEPVDEGP